MGCGTAGHPELAEVGLVGATPAQERASGSDWEHGHHHNHHHQHRHRHHHHLNHRPHDHHHNDDDDDDHHHHHHQYRRPQQDLLNEHQWRYSATFLSCGIRLRTNLPLDANRYQ